jgi:hypothetical protein
MSPTVTPKAAGKISTLYWASRLGAALRHSAARETDIQLRPDQGAVLFFKIILEIAKRALVMSTRFFLCWDDLHPTARA